MIYTIELYNLDVANNALVKKAKIITQRGLNFTNRLNAIGSCQFELSATDALASLDNLQRFRTVIAIKRQTSLDDTPVIVWSGIITKVNGSFDGVDGSIQVEGNTILYALTSRFTPQLVSYLDMDESQILWNVLSDTQNKTNGNLLIQQGTLATSQNRKESYEYKKISDVIIDMSNILDSIDFSFDNVVDGYQDLIGFKFNTYYPQLGSYREDLPPLQLGINVQNLSFSTDGEVYNAGIGIGAGTGSSVSIAEYEATDSEQAYTRRENILNNKDLNLSSSNYLYIQSFINNYSVENWGIDVTLMQGKTPSLGEFNLGDYLNINLTYGNYINFVKKARVTEISVMVDKDGKETVQPKLLII